MKAATAHVAMLGFESDPFILKPFRRAAWRTIPWTARLVEPRAASPVDLDHARELVPLHGEIQQSPPDIRLRRAFRQVIAFARHRPARVRFHRFGVLHNLMLNAVIGERFAADQTKRR